MTVADLPYRFNVGIALFNAAGLVLIAHRIKDDGPEIFFPGFEWQMPQGGVDPGEDPDTAARRELWEETAVTQAEILGRTDLWQTYEFPPYSGPAHKLTPYRGQQQRWVAMRFLGPDSEIDVSGRNGEPAEFDGWRWERLAATVDLVVPFKRHIYAAVARDFARFAA